MRDITKYPPVHPEDEITMLIRHVVKEKKGKLITEGNESFIQRMRNDWDRMFAKSNKEVNNNMTEQQFKDITAWQKETFGEANSLSKIAHLAEELQELVHDLQVNAPDRRLEYADCFLLLFGSAAADGMSYSDICNAIDEKMKINYARKWGKPNEHGVVNHIK